MLLMLHRNRSTCHYNIPRRDRLYLVASLSPPFGLSPSLDNNTVHHHRQTPQSRMQASASSSGIDGILGAVRCGVCVWSAGTPFIPDRVHPLITLVGAVLGDCTGNRTSSAILLDQPLLCIACPFQMLPHNRVALGRGPSSHGDRDITALDGFYKF